MTTTTLPVLTNHDDPMLRLAVAAHLARYKGETRIHTASDLNSYCSAASSGRWTR